MKRFCSFLLVLALAAALLPASFADSPAKLPEADGTVRVYVDGILRERGASCNDALYISLDTLNRVYSARLSYKYDKSAGVMHISDKGLSFSQPLDRIYADVNGGYIFNDELFMLSGDKCYIPWRVAVEMLSVRGEEKDGSIYLRSDKVSYFSASDEYYQEKFGKENVFWLSRLIHAEAMNQPMEALISVGNVVLNRVNDPLHYPFTVKEVIFDDVPVVQFEVTVSGAINLEPDENSLIAAYLCLGGANFCEDSTFFLNPKDGDASWFEEELRYVCTCGDLDFYAMDWGK